MIIPVIIEKDDNSLLESDNEDSGYGSKFTYPGFTFDGSRSPTTSAKTPTKVKEKVEMSNFSPNTSKAKRDQIELVLNFNAANLDGKKRFYQFGATALRYSNFDLFRKQLVTSYPTLIIPPLPPKGILITNLFSLSSSSSSIPSTDSKIVYVSHHLITGPNPLIVKMRLIGLQRFLNRLLSWSSKSPEILQKIKDEIHRLKKDPRSESVTEKAKSYVPIFVLWSKEKVFYFKTELGGILPELKEKIQELKTMITNKLTTENKITKLPVEFKTIVNELFSLREACSPDSISKENKAKAKELNGRFKMFDQALEKQSQIILKYVISCF
jgi:hypothetical protein